MTFEVLFWLSLTAASTLPVVYANGNMGHLFIGTSLVAVCAFFLGRASKER